MDKYNFKRGITNDEIFEHLKSYKHISKFDVTLTDKKPSLKDEKGLNKTNLITYLKANKKGLDANKDMASYLRVSQRTLNRYIHELVFEKVINAELKNIAGGGRVYFIKLIETKGNRKKATSKKSVSKKVSIKNKV